MNMDEKRSKMRGDLQKQWVTLATTGNDWKPKTAGQKLKRTHLR